MPPFLRRALGCLISLSMLLAGVNVAFPQTPLTVGVDLYYSGTWNDITSDTYHRGSQITITRGRQNEGSVCDPGTMSLELNNRSGKYSPRNPNSPLFGLIGRNTQIRVKVTYNAVTYVRFVGEISSWPSRWDVTGRDVWVPIEASGVLKRLSATPALVVGAKPQRSSLYRAMMGTAAGDIVPAAYWPLEDPAGATQLAPAIGTLAGQMTYLGTYPPKAVPLPGTYGNIPGSDLSVTMNKNTPLIVLPMVPYVDTNRWAFQVAVDLVDLNTALTVVGYTKNGFTLIAGITPNNGPGVGVVDYDISGNGISFTGNVNYPSIPYLGGGNPLSLVMASINTPGVGDEFDVRVFNSDGTVVASLTKTNPGVYGVLDQVTVQGDDFGIAGNGDAVMGVAHGAVFTDPSFNVDTSSIDGARAMGGYDGEQAHARFARLCSQVGLSYTVSGDKSAAMGPERIVKLLDALHDCEDADQGFLGERPDGIGLHFVTNAWRYNQAAIALTYTSGHVSPPFEPEPDDFTVANDRIVVRLGGAQTRATLTAGALSTQDPPAGVGRYDDSIDVSLYSDDQVPNVANWRLHVGTWDAERYPKVHVDLSATGNTSLIPSLMAADSGSLITIASLPSWLPPETAELLIEGYEETIAFFDWDLTFNCSPAGPWNVVGVWDMTAVLHTAMNTSVTSADIATTAGPLLATTGLGSGYGITIGGETLQVTAVAASTITYGATGAQSTGSSGSRTPGLPTGAASGNLILIFASTRNSGTGTVDTPASWTRLPIFATTDNCAVFARIYDGVWTMPTVTFTGGAVNEDTLAQSIRLAGKWHSASNVLLASAECLNASAQNIQYPGLALPAADNCIIIYFGWKQDDYTSVATLAGATEIEECFSIAGNDASQIWDFVIQTTAAAVPSGSFVVTGGAGAISRGAIAALRCDYQTATVTRSTNGVSASHSAGDAVSATKPMRWGL